MYYKIQGMSEINQSLLNTQAPSYKKNNYVIVLLLGFIATLSIVAFFIIPKL